MSDPIAAMLTIIRNGQMVNKTFVCTDMSNTKESILAVLKDEGYILDYEIKDMENNKKRLKIKLKYFQGKPVISNIKRISKPSLRIYRNKNEWKFNAIGSGFQGGLESLCKNYGLQV